jgi:large subunit ribosomal protein L3
MTVGIIGRKRGMTRVFTDEGLSIPVTVIEAIPNRVTHLTSTDKQGYRAVQITWGRKKPASINKALAGVYTKAEVDPGEGLAEYRLDEGEGRDLKPGHEIKVDIFEAGQKVDVSGTTIGKGFAGTIKRHNFSRGGMTHGNSLSHRSAGSIGQNQTPGRVFKGKKMAGHLGNANQTAQNLEIVRIDGDKNLILIKGAVPGSKGGRVLIKPATKVRVRT